MLKFYFDNHAFSIFFPDLRDPLKGYYIEKFYSSNAKGDVFIRS